MRHEACDRCELYEAEVRLRYAFVCRPCAELSLNTGVEWAAIDNQLRHRRQLEFNIVLLDRLVLEKQVNA